MKARFTLSEEKIFVFITILFRKSILNPFAKFGQVTFIVQLNHATGKYDVVDSRNQKKVTRAIAITNYNAGAPVGISDLQTE
jgi:type IV secretory pathway component VirB8